jgi:octaprenyl-diphosphate synthase
MNAPALSKPPRADMSMLRQLVADDLVRVNRVILDHAHSDIALINELTAHIVAAGGKRLRPSLTIAAAQLCGYTGTRHINLAACVEFIHTATLLHDDVVDASDLRRGAATANALWGNKSSVLVGDFLFSRAFQLMVADGSLDVLSVLSEASAVIAAGEVHQLMVSHDLAITQTIYEQVISAKTAALFAAACEIGAIVSDTPQWRAPLRAYGHHLGMAFQVVDDALDYQSSAAEMCKAIGDDFRDGKVTLPVIIAYAKATETEREFWQKVMENSEAITAEDLTRANELLVKADAFSACISIATDFAKTAAASIKDFPESSIKAALLEVAAFTVERSY